MRFMVFVKGTDQGPPPQSFIDAIERAAAEAKSAGTLLDTGGLVPATLGPRIRVEGGEITVIDGPFTESKEMVGGYGVVEAASLEEAVAGAVGLMQIHRDHWPGWEGEVEVRQIFNGP
jgi:hypothetical protein